MSAVISKRWVLPEGNPDVHQRLVQELGLRDATAAVLVNRGINGPDDAGSFLAPSPTDLLDPLLLNEMDRAVSRIQDAIRRSERVVIYGDYDVDGITATTLYLEFFSEAGP